MKKVLIFTLLLMGLALTSSANDLLWGSEPNTVSDQNGTLVPTSKTDGLWGAFAQLIWVGLDGDVDDFLYSGTGVTGDDAVISTTYSYGGSGLGDKSGQFKLINAGLSADALLYVRVYNTANSNYANGIAAVITGNTISHYWESATHSFTFDGIGADDQWNFTGGADVQTTQAVPEPATALLFGIGGLGAFIVRRNKKKAQEEA